MTNTKSEAHADNKPAVTVRELSAAELIQAGGGFTLIILLDKHNR